MNKPEEIRSALDSKTIAVVGASRDTTKDSHTVAAYLKAHGYKIIPVNPTTDRILDEPCYKSLLDIPEEKARMIDLVDVFRPSQDVPPIVAEAVRLKKRYGHLKSVWMQLGISNSKAAEEDRREGLHVIQDACIRVEHGRASKKNII